MTTIIRHHREEHHYDSTLVRLHSEAKQQNKILLQLVKSCLSYSQYHVAQFMPSVSQSVSLSTCGTTLPRDTITFPVVSTASE